MHYYSHTTSSVACAVKKDNKQFVYTFMVRHSASAFEDQMAVIVCLQCPYILSTQYWHVPRPRLAFRRFQYGKAGRGPGIFSHVSDIRIERVVHSMSIYTQYTVLACSGLPHNNVSTNIKTKPTFFYLSIYSVILMDGVTMMQRIRC